MTENREELWARAAHAVRPYLNDLLSTEDAESVGRRLALLLVRGHDRAVADDIKALFDTFPELRDWVADFLESGPPPDPGRDRDRQERHLPYLPPPGYGMALQPPKYRCPNDGYVWYQRSASIDPPRCPCGAELERADST
ncbi:hypothetical protein AB0O34_26165 [Sphaerisporangium sp. NPDC088356]|uniref:hypothetical protein n=1 Tax=Sphaerisporangium sp. NPDC088356 TaxID=3154871 RepID=UPI0034493E4E